jgi:hypothetical protein
LRAMDELIGMLYERRNRAVGMNYAPMARIGIVTPVEESEEASM